MKNEIKRRTFLKFMVATTTLTTGFAPDLQAEADGPEKASNPDEFGMTINHIDEQNSEYVLADTEQQEQLAKTSAFLIDAVKITNQETANTMVAERKYIYSEQQLIAIDPNFAESIVAKTQSELDSIVAETGINPQAIETQYLPMTLIKGSDETETYICTRYRYTGEQPANYNGGEIKNNSLLVTSERDGDRFIGIATPEQNAVDMLAPVEVSGTIMAVPVKVYQLPNGEFKLGKILSIDQEVGPLEKSYRAGNVLSETTLNDFSQQTINKLSPGVYPVIGDETFYGGTPILYNSNNGQIGLVNSGNIAVTLTHQSISLAGFEQDLDIINSLIEIERNQTMAQLPIPENAPTPEAVLVGYAENREKVNNLPPQTWKTENGYASPVPISPETLTFSLKDGDLYAETTSGEKLVWIDGSGWAMVQFNTEFVEVVIDIDFTTNTGRERAAGDQSYIFDTKQTQSIQEIRSDPGFSEISLSIQESRDWFAIHRGDLENSILSTNPQDGKEAFDNIIITAVAMIKNNTEKPSDEELEAARELMYSDEPIAINTPFGTWNPRKNRYLLAPYPEKAGWYRNIKGTMPENYFTVNEQGRGTIRMTSNSTDSWGASVGLLTPIEKLLTEIDIPCTGKTQNGIRDYSFLFKTLFSIQDNAVIWPIMAGNGTINSGGKLDYSVFGK